MKENKVINVTQPFLPPLEEYTKYLQQIWENKILTNGGELHKQLETELAAYLGVPHISLFSNGTIALITALQALDIRGEVITTPYSFVATTNSLLWNGAHPVFADVDPLTCNLDPIAVRKAITKHTVAIMPVHVYGVPCNLKAFEELAKEFNLKLIYDAAHAFGVKQDGESVLNAGDLSILSFHATKVFNTVEGGAIVSHSAEMKKRIDDLKNFGIVNEVTVVAPGINGKLNEFQAAFGLLNLKYLNVALAKRKMLHGVYAENLRDVTGIDMLDISGVHEYNYAYFPVFVRPAFRMKRDELYMRLKQAGVNGRRYFYPLISDFPIYSHLPSAKGENLTHGRTLADQVICLPLYPDLSADDVRRICKLIATDIK